MQVYDGKSGVLTLKNQAFAFDPTFRRGITLAIRDMNGDGSARSWPGPGTTATWS